MNDQQKAFADAWMDNGHNATQAALTAKYDPNSAYSQGHRLLKHDEVRKYLDVELKKRAAESLVDLTRWVDALETIAYAEIGQAVDLDTGKLKDSASIPADVLRAIEKVEVDSQGRRRVTLASKLKALELLGRHRAYLKDDDKSGVTLVFQVSEKDGLL